ncbi:MAG TPA: ATP-binding protein [Bacteroidia bacterium]|jgi:signal transduction histidine kinase/DNA-binding NarL/FixJ family response regulator|nr:ATP-binding protein [Bacteroidia bacterium]
MKTLVNRIHEYFIPKRNWEGEEELRKSKMLVNTLLLSILFGAFYFLNTVYFVMPHIMYNMIFCITAFSITLVLFKLGISRTLAANIFSALAFFCTVFDVYYSAGLQSWSIAWLCMSPVLAVLLMDKKYGYVWLAASLLAGLVIGIMNMNGYHFPNDVKPEYMDLMTLNAKLGLILIMFSIAMVLNEAYSRSMARLTEKNQDIQWQKALAEQERRRAIQSEQLKQEFLTNMSHEIRTPMNAILGLTNLLLEKNPTEQQLHDLKIIKSSSESLYAVINDILDLSKIEAGKLELEETEFELKQVIETVAKIFEHKADEKGLVMSIYYDNTIPQTLLGDPTRLNQVLTNLVSNAIKFTGKGEIGIKAEHEGDNKIKFSVSDTGIGMTRKQREIIFEPFRQADAGTSRRYGGTGLGLSISKELVELHNSKLCVESQLGKGSTFSFTIKFSLSDSKSVKANDALITSAMLEELKGLRILLVEDNEFNNVVAIETLRLKIPGVVINTAVNGREAVDKLPGNDMVLMDMHMPVMDGYEATTKIRKEYPPPLCNVPIIALTAWVLENNFDRFFEIGINDVLPKPFKTDVLLLAIYNVVKGKPATAVSKKQTRRNAEPLQKVTDVNTLKIFCEEDDARVKKYIGMYLQSAPVTLVKLDTLLKQMDFQSLHREIHTFKTHLKYMGMDRVAYTAKKVEQMCLDGQNDVEIGSLLKNINEACHKSYIELKEHL